MSTVYSYHRLVDRKRPIGDASILWDAFNLKSPAVYAGIADEVAPIQNAAGTIPGMNYVKLLKHIRRGYYAQMQGHYKWHERCST
jgi:hypothetical protein